MIMRGLVSWLIAKLELARDHLKQIDEKLHLPKSALLVFLCCFLFSNISSPSFAMVPQSINIQGQATDASGVLLASPPTIGFMIKNRSGLISYSSVSSPPTLTISSTNYEPKTGVFNCVIDLLGKTNVLDDGNAGITTFINSISMGEQKLNSVPYAFRAAVAESLVVGGEGDIYVKKSGDVMSGNLSINSTSSGLDISATGTSGINSNGKIFGGNFSGTDAAKGIGVHCDGNKIGLDAYGTLTTSLSGNFSGGLGVKIGNGLNLVPGPFHSVTAAAGDIYCDNASSPNKLKFYNGTAWVDLSGGTGGAPASGWTTDGSSQTTTNYKVGIGVGSTTPQSTLHVFGTITTPWGFTYQHYDSAYNTSDKIHPYFKQGWGDALGDHLYVGATGNRSNSSQSAMLLTANSGILFGRGDDSGDMLSSEWMRITNNGFLGLQPKSDPGSGITSTAGQIYYSSTDNKLKYYNGTKWVVLSDSGSVGNPFKGGFEIWGSLDVWPLADSTGKPPGYTGALSQILPAENVLTLNNKQAPISADGSLIIASQLAGTLSDMRLKTNIKTLPSTLDKISRLRGVTFNWKEPRKNGEGEQVGMIAQELEKEYPQLVGTNKEGYKMIYYDQLTAVLLEAIKELRADNVALKGQVQKLEKKVTVLENKNK